MFDVMSQARRARRLAARGLPATRRSRRPKAAVVAAPIVAVAGVAAVAGLLFWDERRRAAMRRRMEEVAGSVGATVSSGLNRHRVDPPVPTGAAGD
jgi:transposase